MGRVPRMTFGAVIGLMAGASFGLTIFPLVLDKLMPSAPGAAYLLMARLALPASLLWIPGGVLASLAGGARKGALRMGLASLIAGLIYGFLVAPGKVLLPMVTISALTAALYGAGAGLLVGAGFPEGRPDGPNDEGGEPDPSSDQTAKTDPEDETEKSMGDAIT